MYRNLKKNPSYHSFQEMEVVTIAEVLLTLPVLHKEVNIKLSQNYINYN